MIPTWLFSKDPDREWSGINEAGVETFNKRPLVSLAREIPQNSKDVRADSNLPIRLLFEKKFVPAVEIPGLVSLQEKLMRVSQIRKLF